jgi:hypothetical protein
VLLSSLDAWSFESDSLVRAVWLDSLVAAYDGPVTFRPAAPAGNVGDLFVAPTVRVWLRRGLPLPRAF